jgi:enamine deaminase RidA (YjgF/YER057c/UK114 family)
MTVHHINPKTLTPPVGFSHAVIAHGTVVFLAGQTAQDTSGQIVGITLLQQFDQALKNLVCALTEAGSRPELLTKVVIYTTDPDGYTGDLHEVGVIWRSVIGRVYPAMTFVGVNRLFDPAALVEVEAYAVVE